ncbi:MAG: restriction endonuclease subunit S [Endomicrobium sp.]|nr:restriction endonuclease subunit S [Endomicrobium sp.]
MKDSILICTASGSKNHLGKIALIDKEYDYAFGGFMGQIIPAKQMLSKFLFYILTMESYKSFIQTLTDGVNINNLRFSQLSEFVIPVPTVSEQQKIVSKLDKLFENTKKLEDIARRNLQNSKDIFNSVLNETFRNKWEMKKLGDVCDVIAGQSPDGKYYNNNGKGLPFYQGKKEFTDKYIGCPTVWTTEITREAKKGDILMSVRAPVGPINFATEKICIGRGLAAIRPINEKEFSNDYLFLFLISIQDKIKGSAGAVFASINKKQIEDILVLVPSRDEQKRIVSKLDELSLRTKELEVIYQKKINDLAELKQSALKQAFCY